MWLPGTELGGGRSRRARTRRAALSRGQSRVPATTSASARAVGQMPKHSMLLVLLLPVGALALALPTSHPSLDRAFRAADAVHAAELMSDVAIALTPDENELLSAGAAPFADDAFITHDIGLQYAGPDAGQLLGAQLVHRTSFPVLSGDECNALREEAAAALARGATSSFTYTAAERLGEVHVADLPEARTWLRAKLQSSLLPLLSSRFGVDASTLRVYDSLIIRYDASQNATRQPMHRDAALISLNIALSSEDECNPLPLSTHAHARYERNARNFPPTQHQQNPTHSHRALARRCWRRHSL